MVRRNPSQMPGRVRWNAPDVAPELAIECPRCKASRGSTCLDLKSWHVEPDHPDGGVYTRRNRRLHSERREAWRATQTQSACDPRTALRDRLRELARRKQSGHARLATLRWAGSSRRAPEELDEKIAQLEQMGDLPW